MKLSKWITAVAALTMAANVDAAFLVNQLRAIGGFDINNTGEAYLIWNEVPLRSNAPQPLTVGGETYTFDVDYFAIHEVANWGSGGGNFAGNPLPAGPGSGGNDWTTRVFADITIPAGDWTIGFGSDDGGFMQIPGVTFLESTADAGFDNSTWGGGGGNGGGPGNLSDSPGPVNAGTDTLWYGNGRGHGWTIGTFSLAADLETTITSFFWERGGGDSFEIAVIDSHNLNRSGGNNSGDDDIIVGQGWQLLQDGVFGIALSPPPPTPEPSTTITIFFGISLLAIFRRLRDEVVSKRWNK